ncbi:methyl-accepting chemotaxis protein [Iodobacter sp.]|uniref:methyl-accepting chemotaxis protein n=1 Tax=Iodobacter sp. TaxID=1915058 RepID=UPI0025EBFD9D|nr:methyl-accepting chemotaxis protein [Iodobacter sp.]
MTISKRLILLITLALTSSLLIATIAWQQLNYANESLQRMAEQNIPAIHTLNKISLAFKERRVQLYQHIMAKDLASKKTHEPKIMALNQDIEDAARLLNTSQLSSSTGELSAALAAYTPVFTEVLKLSQENNEDEAQAYVQAFGTTVGMRVNAALKNLADANTRAINQEREQFNAEQQQAKWVFLSIVLMSCLMLLSLGTYIYTQIRKPLQSTVSTMQSIADHMNLSLRIPQTSRDEIGQMVQTINQVLAQIQSSFQQIKQSSLDVNQAAGGLAQMAEQQAGNAEAASETASSMAATVEEVSSSIHLIAERSQETHQLSQAAFSQAEQGIAVIDNTVEQIYGIAAQVDEASRELGELQERNKEIQSMVQIIKEIADQTSLLALNAAIEAARAGEEGRGFAVVADEVRKLAERTTRSTQQIVASVDRIHQGANRAAERMLDVVGRVDQGVSMVGEAGKSMREIRKASQNVAAQVSDISLAIREQSTASHAMAMQVERTASMAEEAHAAARHEADSAKQLRQLADAMQSEVNRYQLS